MSDILDDLKMMADHCDQENGDEPCDLGMLLIRAIAEIRKLRQQPVSAVEVPMPVGWANWYPKGAHVIFGLSIREPREVLDREQVAKMSDVLTYGDAREAAGYAAGVAAGGKDAERYRYLRNRDAQFVLTTSGPEAGCFIDFENEDGMLVLLTGADADALIDAALRGEVKP